MDLIWIWNQICSDNKATFLKNKKYKSEMQTGKGEKGENIVRIGGMLHTEFILKIFALHAHL